MYIVYRGRKDHFCQGRKVYIMKSFKEMFTYLED